MPRPKQTVPSSFRNSALPKPLADTRDLVLFSELEGRIPTGAYKIFFSNLLEQYFEQTCNPCKHCNGTGVKGLL